MRVGNKRGMTLVELIVAAVVTVLVIAAACSALYYGMGSLKSGAAGLSDHTSVDLLDKYLQGALSTAKSAELSTTKLDHTTLTAKETGTSFYFSTAGVLMIERDGEIIAQVENISTVLLKTNAAGQGGNATKRLDYEITAISAKGESLVISSSVVMLNSKSTAPSIDGSLAATDTITVLNVIGAKK